MERFTISLDEKLASEFDHLIRERGYLNRSEVVRRFADTLIAERGVRHGQVNLVPVDVDAGHGHVHSHPKT